MAMDATEKGLDWPSEVEKKGVYPDVQRDTTWQATVPAEEDYAWYSHYNLQNCIFKPRVAEVLVPARSSATGNAAVSSVSRPLAVTSRESRSTRALFFWFHFPFAC